MGSEDATLTAVFERIHTLTLQASPTIGGTPTIETPTGESTGTIAEGESTTLHASPNEGYQFVRWTIVSGSGNTITDVTSPTTTFTMGSSPTSVRAEYELIPHTLNVQASPTTGGNPTAEQTTLGMGQTTILTANPAPGYQFIGWVSSNGGKFEDANSPITTFTMPNNNTVITANFKIQELTFLDFFPDLNLAQVVADSFGREITDEVSEEELNNLTGTINGMYSNISDLEGVQHLTGISILNLDGNELTNESLKPLSHLANNLAMLYLDHNQISDLSLFPGSLYPALTITAIDQEITLDSINEGDMTEGVFIRTRDGQAPSSMSFNPTGGSYYIENGMITWAGVGENTLTWREGTNFSGTITQLINPQ